MSSRYSSTKRFVFRFLEEDIDGETLLLLQHDDIVQIFPRIKDRVKFVNLRSKLISDLNEQQEDVGEVPSNFIDLTLSYNHPNA